MFEISRIVQKIGDEGFYSVACNGSPHFIEAAEELSAERISGGLFAEEKVSVMLAELLIDYARFAFPDQDTLRNEPCIQAICDRINRHPSRPYSLDWAAKKSCMSRTGFMKKFKLFTGMTFIEYMHSARIRLAMKLCGDRTLSISEIAYRSGFNNPGYFHTVFRHHCDMSPLKFRKVLLAQGEFPIIIKKQFFKTR